MSNVLHLTKAGPKRYEERRRLARMFGRFSKDDIRRFWDDVRDDDFFYVGKEGCFDGNDIHSYMNMTGDGQYCAV